MRNKRKPVIEVDRVHIMSPLSPRYETWCRGCGAEVELVKIDEAAEIAGTNTAAIIERAAAGEIHLAIRPEALLFCTNSLVRNKEFGIPPGVRRNPSGLALTT
jgi:hypothetical protein